MGLPATVMQSSLGTKEATHVRACSTVHDLSQRGMIYILYSGELVQHSAYRRSSHRRKGATSPIIDMVGLFRSPLVYCNLFDFYLLFQRLEKGAGVLMWDYEAHVRRLATPVLLRFCGSESGPIRIFLTR
jgi:hypothetical protein